MKQLLFATIAAASLILSVNTHAQNSQPSNQNAAVKAKKKNNSASSLASMQQTAMAYTPTYSGQFMMGKPEHTRLVMDLLKDYETNSFALGDAIADTVMVVFSDGKIVRGIGPATETFKKARASIADPQMKIAAAIPVRSTDRKEDWVLVWGSSHDGNEVSNFHHGWRFNRDGKIDYLRMFTGGPVNTQQ